MNDSLKKGIFCLAFFFFGTAQVNAREEFWVVDTHGYRAEFSMTVDDQTGQVKGDSSWVNGPVSDRITGTIDEEKNEITIVRELSGSYTGKIQTYTGQYYYNKTVARGRASGTGIGESTWETISINRLEEPNQANANAAAERQQQQLAQAAKELQTQRQKLAAEAAQLQYAADLREQQRLQQLQVAQQQAAAQQAAAQQAAAQQAAAQLAAAQQATAPVFVPSQPGIVPTNGPTNSVTQFALINDTNITWGVTWVDANGSPTTGSQWVTPGDSWRIENGRRGFGWYAIYTADRYICSFSPVQGAVINVTSLQACR